MPIIWSVLLSSFKVKNKILIIGVDQNCGSCKPCDITFTPKHDPGTIESYWRNYVADSNGCLSLDAICTSSPGGYVFMEFNGHIGGPVNIGNEIIANLNCANGSWVFTQSGYSTVINQIKCLGY